MRRLNLKYTVSFCRVTHLHFQMYRKDGFESCTFFLNTADMSHGSCLRSIVSDNAEVWALSLMDMDHGTRWLES